MLNDNINYLMENGPSPVSDLPSSYVTPEAKMNGVWKFDLRGVTGNGGAPDPTGGRITPVYYLIDEHPKTEVLDVFLKSNPGLVENKTKSGIVQMLNGHGRGWRDAVQQEVNKRYE